MDEVDLQILDALYADARISNKELAARVNLSPGACSRRVRLLEEAGAIRGYHADIDELALGLDLQAMIAVRLQKHSRDLVDDFRAHVLRMPQVLSIFHVAGEYDFLLQVTVGSSTELRDFALDRLTTRPEVEHLETSLIFEHTQTWTLPKPAGGAR